LGARSLAAVAVGASVWFLGFVVCLGLLMAISPIAARHHGAGESALVGRYRRLGMVVGAVLGVAVLAVVYVLAAPALTFLGVDSGFRGLTIDYVRAIILGGPAICVFLALRFTTEGIGFTKPIMYLSLFALV